MVRGRYFELTIRADLDELSAACDKMVDGGRFKVKRTILAFVLALSAATSAIAEDKMCITKQWYGALALRDMEQAIVYLYENDTAALNRMIEEKKVGVFHEGTEVFITERYTSKNGNNLVHIRRIGTAIEIWTHMAAVACR
jgi:hypothetical protein